MAFNKNSSTKNPQSIEEVYSDFESKLLALKKEKDQAVDLIMRQIDDQKIKKILSKIK